MKFSFTAFEIALDAIDLETGQKVGIQIEGTPMAGFTMTMYRDDGKDTAAAASANGEVVDLTEGSTFLPLSLWRATVPEPSA